MLKNYFKIALRNLRRQPAFLLINISGLLVGIACCLMILLYVQHELAYDRFHENADDVYRLTRHSLTESETRGYANTPAAAGPALQTEYSEVENMVRFMLPMPREVQVNHEAQRFEERGLYWVDAGVFDMFDFNLLVGNPEIALVEPFSIVVTQEIAAKYFGEENPIGKRLTIQGWQPNDYVVTGILAEVPAQSHLQFDMLASLSGEEPIYTYLFSGEGQWSNSLFYTYVQLHEGSDAAYIASELPGFADRHMGAYAQSRGFEPTFALQPITKIHLHSQLTTEREPTGGILYVYIFLAIAGFILLIACINFMNLSTARSSQRVKEIGIRKVMGAWRKQLVQQFLGESMLLVSISFIGAVMLVLLLLPAFNQFVGKTLTPVTLGLEYVIPFGVGLIIFVGLLAGSYPALFLSGFKPISVLKKDVSSVMRGAGFRKFLVVFQFTASIILIVSTLVIYAQVEFLQHRPLGFNAEQTVLLPLNDRLIEQREAIKTTLAAHPNIRQTAVSSGVPGQLRLIDRFPMNSAGAADDLQSPVYIIGVDHDYLDLIEVEWVEGRNFDRGRPADAASGFILSELAVQQLGLEQPIGAQVTLKEGESKTGEVIGVVKDFHLKSLHHPLEPLAIRVWPERFTTLSVKVGSDNLAETLDFLASTWRQFAPEALFSYKLLDENFAIQYASEYRFGIIMRLFAGLAILIACLGLLGLVSFMAERRVKEIGVRKVLGASAPVIVGLLSADFLKLVLIAFFVAVPISYITTNWWLAGFAYRIQIPIGLYLLAGLTAIVVAISTLAYQALRAAYSNPIDALRYE